MKTIFGSLPTIISVNRVFSKDSGWQTTVTYRGEKNSIASLAARLKNQAESVDVIDEDGTPMATLRVVYGNAYDGTTEELEEVWEFPSNVATIDILSHPLAAGLPHMVLKHLRELREGSLIRAVGSQISKSKDGHDAFHWTSNNANANIDIVYGDNANGDGLKFAKLIMAGVENYYESQLVVQVSVTVSGSYAIQMSTAMACKVLPPATFNSVMHPPPDCKVILPSSGNFPAPSGWQWGYLAQQPDIRMVGGGKWRITQEFWFGLWSTTLYPTYTP